MKEKFKEFLAGSPNWFDAAEQEKWTALVDELPQILREWHDPNFGADVWAKNKAYYETARQRLSVLSAFKKHCPDKGDVLHALKLLSLFFEDEARKAARGTTTKKPVLVGATSGANSGQGQPAQPAVQVLEEGEIKEMHIAKHERNAALRKTCIEHWRAQQGGKVSCAACGMSFGERYGAVGEGYIEVHHLNPISQIEGVHAVDPETDLVPLCANCHAMIHRIMAAEKKATGASLEGQAALGKLKDCLNV